MAFKYDFGDGRLGDAVIENGVCKNFNSYARVTSINQNVIEIENISEGEFAKFTAGEKILLHISASNRDTGDFLGRYQIATIELVSENKLTLSENIFDCDLNFEYLQIISIPQFKNLTLKNATLTPPPYDVFKFRGGILVAQVFDTFEMVNSFIDLTDCGIPFQKKNTYRPLTTQEISGETDKSQFAGEENLTPLILNAGDGTVFIQARNFIADEVSRIGNPKTHGKANCRGAADSAFKPSNVTNVGGSSIFIACESITYNLTPILAKYRSADAPAGRGLSRCYIASNTILPDDEKLYHFDILEDLSLVQKLGVENFGVGTVTLERPNFQLNNFAQVTNVIGNKLYFKNKTLSGYAPYSLVLIRNSEGEFKISRVLNYGENFVTVKNLPENPVEIISIAEFENLTLENYNCEKFLGVAVSDTLTISGEINISNCLKLNCGNAQSFNKVSGIFILAKKIIFAENCRLKCGSMIICNDVENFSEEILAGEPNFIYN